MSSGEQKPVAKSGDTAAASPTTPGSVAPNINAASIEAVNPTVSKRIIDKKELTLLQLCFDESEFGVPMSPTSPHGSLPVGSTDSLASYSAAGTEAEDADFDAATFVTEKLQHVPLATLKADLQTYHQYLQGAIMQKIHDSVHEAFIEVSGQLVSTQDDMLKVQTPLRSTLQRVEHAVAALNDLKANVDNHLHKAQEFELERMFNANLLQVLLVHDRLCGTMEKVQHLQQKLGVVVEDQYDSRNLSPTRQKDGNSPTQPHPSPAVAASKSAQGHNARDGLTDVEITQLTQELLKALHAAVAELSQLQDTERSLEVVNAGAVGNAPYVAEREEARALVEEDMQVVLKCLAASFLDTHQRVMETPSSEHTTILTGLLQCYTLLGQEDVVGSLYREHIVRPAVEDVISWKKAAEARQSSDASNALLNSLCERLEENVLVILPLVRDVLAPAINPLSNIVWPVVSEVIQKRMSYLFVPGLPATFHTHYTSAHKVVAMLESRCTTVEELREFRASPEMSTVWRRKWNLEVYKTLRVQEVQSMTKKITSFMALELASAVGATPTGSPAAAAPAAAPAGGFKSVQRFKQLQDLKEVMMWPFNDDVFLYPLAGDFIKCALGAQVEVSERMLELAKKPKAGTSEDDENAVDTAMLLRLSADFEDFQKFLSHTFVKRLEAVTFEAASGTSSPLAGIVSFAINAAQTASRSAVDTVKSSIVAECGVSLGSVRTIKTAYSMTKKPMPSSPSWFVGDILAPIGRFRDAAEEKKIASPDQLKGLVADMVEEVTNNLRAATKDTIVQARKQAESLDKIRRKKDQHQSVNANGNGTTNERPTHETATDRDKMVVQLYLDAHEFGNLLRPFGINKESYAPLQSVLKLVRRANWILGDDIPEPAEVEDDE